MKFTTKGIASAPTEITFTADRERDSALLHKLLKQYMETGCEGLNMAMDWYEETVDEIKGGK